MSRRSATRQGGDQEGRSKCGCRGQEMSAWAKRVVVPRMVHVRDLKTVCRKRNKIQRRRTCGKPCHEGTIIFSNFVAVALLSTQMKFGRTSSSRHSSSIPCEFPVGFHGDFSRMNRSRFLMNCHDYERTKPGIEPPFTDFLRGAGLVNRGQKTERTVAGANYFILRQTVSGVGSRKTSGVFKSADPGKAHLVASKENNSPKFLTWRRRTGHIPWYNKRSLTSLTATGLHP